MKMNIQSYIEEHQDVVSAMQNDEILHSKMTIIIEDLVEIFKGDGRLLICGNGGSAADAQHLAAEFSGRFTLNRKPLDAEALHVNTSYITAVGNDYDFETIYERALVAKGRKGDMLFAISTSGNSENIIRASKKAKELGIKVVGFTGEKECKLDALADVLIKIPSMNTPRIQEAYMILGHIICEKVERILFA
jgi:D-sedoheptulose 7-phosphate isomerase